MSNIPDFVHQVQDIERSLSSEWQTVQDGWRDNVAERFHHEVMEPYMQNFSQYINGTGLNGFGLEQLLRQMDGHLQQMDSLTH